MEFPKNEWHHLTVGINRSTPTSATVYIYVDGVLKGSQQYSGINSNAITSMKNGTARLGQDLNNRIKNKLYLDEIRFWSILLDSSTINSNFDRLITGKEYQLEIFYRCD